MATGPQIRGEIAKLTGVSESVAETVNRRLGEAELLPHRRRGRHAEHYQPIHVARLLVGVMAVSDAFGTTVTGAPHVLQRLSALQRTRGGGIVLKSEDGTHREKIARGGNFVDAVADIITSMRGETDISDDVRARKWRIGLAYGAGSYLAYVGEEANPAHLIDYVRPGDDPARILGASMVQNVHVTGEVLRALADILEVEASSKRGSATRDTQRDQLKIVSGNG